VAKNSTVYNKVVSLLSGSRNIKQALKEGILDAFRPSIQSHLNSKPPEILRGQNKRGFAEGRLELKRNGE